jgi:hypothetical protein
MINQVDRGCNGGIKGSITKLITNDTSMLVCLPNDLLVSENGKYAQFEGHYKIQ